MMKSVNLVTIDTAVIRNLNSTARITTIYIMIVRVYKMYCPKCKTDVETIVKEMEEVYPVKGRDTKIIAMVRFCTVCGEDIWDDELDSKNLLKAFKKYEEKTGIKISGLSKNNEKSKDEIKVDSFI